MNLFDRDPGQAKERIQEKSQRRGYLILPGYVQLVSSKKKDNFTGRKQSLRYCTCLPETLHVGDMQL